MNPRLITPGSGKKAWWKCNKCGFEWQSRVSHRVEGSGCPICSRKKVAERVGKTVYQFSLDGKLVAKYDSAAEAKRQTGVSGIYDCCNHRLETSGGYVWKYADEMDDKDIASVPSEP